MFVFLLAGHEVGQILFFPWRGLRNFPADRSAYTMLLICLVGPPSG